MLHNVLTFQMLKVSFTKTMHHRPVHRYKYNLKGLSKSSTGNLKDVILINYYWQYLAHGCTSWYRLDGTRRLPYRTTRTLLHPFTPHQRKLNTTPKNLRKGAGLRGKNPDLDP